MGDLEGQRKMTNKSTLLSSDVLCSITYIIYAGGEDISVSGTHSNSKEISLLYS
jgi:hypothetical protein